MGILVLVDKALIFKAFESKDSLVILDKFKYVSNVAILHTEEKLMPKKKIAWTSWNSISNKNLTCVTYWLNNLQNLKCNSNYFLTLNPIYEIPVEKIIKKVNFTHPYFNSETSKLQKELQLLQGQKNTWYCGSYFGYGFHEDGIKSAVKITRLLDVEIPWGTN